MTGRGQAASSIEPLAVSRVLSRINPRWTLRRRQPLSRRACLLRVGDSASSEQLVLLRHSDADRAFNPDIARDEYRLLERLIAAGLPVAQPLALAAQHDPPFLITSFLRGAPCFAAEDLAAFCQQLAETLSAIHAVAGAPSFLPRATDVLAADIDERRRGDERIRAALRAAYPGISRNAPVLLHGDFWLGNLLWQGQRLTGIVDWEDAMLGDPLADLGKSRLEMLWALGAAAMRRYSAQYLALNSALDRGALPFWDLWGAARLSHFATFAADADAARRMRRQYERFVDAALAALQK